MNALRRHPFLAALGALFAAGLVVAGINAFDRELTPEARAFFTRPTVKFSPESGWALLAGFHAPPGEEPRAWGTAIHKASLQRKPGSFQPRSAVPLEVRAPDELALVADPAVRAVAMAEAVLEPVQFGGCVTVGEQAAESFTHRLRVVGMQELGGIAA